MDLTKPVIAAIEGWCVAGGLELALMADLRIADSDSKMGVLNRRFGVPLIDGGTVRSVDFSSGLFLDIRSITLGEKTETQNSRIFGQNFKIPANLSIICADF